MSISPSPSSNLIDPASDPFLVAALAFGLVMIRKLLGVSP
jgi:hypothetical protein